MKKINKKLEYNTELMLITMEEFLARMRRVQKQ